MFWIGLCLRSSIIKSSPVKRRVIKLNLKKHIKVWLYINCPLKIFVYQPFWSDPDIVATKLHSEDDREYNSEWFPWKSSVLQRPLSVAVEDCFFDSVLGLPSDLLLSLEWQLSSTIVTLTTGFFTSEELIEFSGIWSKVLLTSVVGTDWNNWSMFFNVKEDNNCMKIRREKQGLKTNFRLLCS